MLSVFWPRLEVVQRPEEAPRHGTEGPHGWAGHQACLLATCLRCILPCWPCPCHSLCCPCRRPWLPDVWHQLGDDLCRVRGPREGNVHGEACKGWCSGWRCGLGSGRQYGAQAGAARRPWPAVHGNGRVGGGELHTPRRPSAPSAVFHGLPSMAGTVHRRSPACNDKRCTSGTWRDMAALDAWLGHVPG